MLEMYTQVVVLTLLLTGSFYVCQAQTCYANLNQAVGENYPQCADKSRAAETAPFEDTLRDLVCDPTCGPLYEATFFSLCPHRPAVGLLLVEYHLSLCKVNDNGQVCYTFYNDSEADMSVANNTVLQLCRSSAQGNCTDQCRAQLMAISSYYGTCINSVFNSTYFRIFDPLVPLFSYQLWTNCDVPVPVDGVVPPTNSAITRLRIGIILAMLCVMLAALLSYTLTF